MLSSRKWAISHEAGSLRLDISKARARLGWRPSLPLAEALDWIVDWHRQVGAGGDARGATLAQIAAYAERAAAIGVPFLSVDDAYIAKSLNR